MKLNKYEYEHKKSNIWEQSQISEQKTSLFPTKKKKKQLETEGKKPTRNSFPKPLKVKCFMKDCGRTFFINYNPAVGMPSQKNYWLYWVDESWNYKEARRKSEDKRGDKICPECLRDIYLSKRWEFLDQIKSEGKRQTLRSYIYHNII
jgi:hypothetical protein